MNIIRFSRQWFSILQVKIRIRVTYRRLFRLESKLAHLGELTISKINWDEDKFYFFSVIQISQNMHRVKSMHLLLKNGLSSDAWLVYRAMIENILDYDYITKNRSKLELYFQYSTFLDIKRLERQGVVRSLSPEEINLKKELNIEWIKNEHLFKNKFGRIRDFWRDRGLPDIARDAKLELLYNLGYKEANDHIHANSNLLLRSVKGKTEEGLHIKAGEVYEEDELNILLAGCQILFLHMLMLANNSFKLGLGKKLKKMEQQILHGTLANPKSEERQESVSVSS